MHLNGGALAALVHRTLIFIVVIGGIGTIEGPIIGVAIFALMQNYLTDFGAVYLILLGGIAIVVMLLAPRGIFGLVLERWGIAFFPLRRHLATKDGLKP